MLPQFATTHFETRSRLMLARETLEPRRGSVERRQIQGVFQIRLCRWIRRENPAKQLFVKRGPVLDVAVRRPVLR